MAWSSLKTLKQGGFVYLLLCFLLTAFIPVVFAGTSRTVRVHSTVQQTPTISSPSREHTPVQPPTIHSYPLRVISPVQQSTTLRGPLGAHYNLQSRLQSTIHLQSTSIHLQTELLHSGRLNTIGKQHDESGQEGWPTFNLILLIGDTTAPPPEDCCREGWPPLLLLFLLDCSVCHAVSLLVVHACLHPSSAHESRLHQRELVCTVSTSVFHYSLLLRFITSTNFFFDKRLWFS